MSSEPRAAKKEKKGLLSSNRRLEALALAKRTRLNRFRASSLGLTSVHRYLCVRVLIKRRSAGSMSFMGLSDGQRTNGGPELAGQKVCSIARSRLTVGDRLSAHTNDWNH